MDILNNSVETKAQELGLVKNELTNVTDLSKMDSNPYKGTFEEVYNMVADGTIRPLVKNGEIIGGDVTKAPEGYTDSEASYYFGQVYGTMLGTKYAMLAFKLKSYNLRPVEIVGEGYNSKVNALGTWFNIDGNEVDEPKDDLPEENAEAEERVIVEASDDDLPDEVEVEDEDELQELGVRDYLRLKYGRCLARGCEPYYDEDDMMIYDIEWGRKLTEGELEKIRAKH